MDSILSRCQFFPVWSTDSTLSNQIPCKLFYRFWQADSECWKEKEKIQNRQLCSFFFKSLLNLGFPPGSAGKESAYNVGDLDSIPGSGRAAKDGDSYPLQYSSLENSHGQRSLEEHSQRLQRIDTTERLACVYWICYNTALFYGAFSVLFCFGHEACGILNPHLLHWKAKS